MVTLAVPEDYPCWLLARVPARAKRAFLHAWAFLLDAWASFLKHSALQLEKE